jgi:signal transduction histidine kinase/ActR/RegA family two-component response regulator
VPSPDGAGSGITAVEHPDPAARAALAPAAGPLAPPAETVFRPVLDEPVPPILPASLAAFVEAHPVHGVLVVPLRSEGRSLGAIAVFRHDRRTPLTGHDRLLVEALADRAAAAVAYARLQASHAAAARRLALLADASRAFSEAHGDVTTLLDALVRRAAEALGAACAVSLLTPERSSLVVHAFHHPDPALRAVLAEAVRAPFALGEGATGRVVTTGKPLLIALVDATNLPPLSRERRPFFDAHPPSTLVVVPLLVGGRVEGALSASRYDAAAPAFDPADQALLEELADRAGLALGQAREHAELARERARLAEVLERAESASRAKDEFLAMLSHELRNPLAPITTALRLLAARDEGRPSRERDVIERQVAHLVRLVDDLLDVSRVTRGKVRLEPRPVSLPDVVARAIETASPLLEARRHVLEVRVAQDLVLQADPHRVAQVIANLLSNAAKYTDPGGRIVLAAEADGREARISVTDTGIGLSPALLPHVFDLFVQGERTLDRAPGGLGIGLTIVRSLVDLHGGRVAAESAGAGRGSTFTVWLPRAEGPPAVRSVPAAAAASPAAASRVLVVDDNEDAAELLAESLRLEGHEVHVAYDGPSALAMAAQVHPRIALLDLGLPVMDGYELAGRLRASEAAIGLVAVTGYGQEMDRRASARAGFAEHLVKPVDLDRVSQVVARLAGGLDPVAATH